MIETKLKIHLKGQGPIAMVDDSDSTLMLVEVYYKKSKLKVPFLTFLGGEPFFEYADTYKDDPEKIPELLFLDINMPGMDGFEVLEILKSKEEFKDIPVCAMLTSSDHELDKQTAFKLGADDYIVKPNIGTYYLELFNTLAKQSL